MYIRGGYNVYPAEVERVLSEHPAVAQIAVLGVPDPVLGEIGAAFVVACVRTVRPSWPSSARSARPRSPTTRRPTVSSLVDALPLTSVGKVDKRALAEDAALGRDG